MCKVFIFFPTYKSLKEEKKPAVVAGHRPLAEPGRMKRTPLAWCQQAGSDKKEKPAAYTPPPTVMQQQQHHLEPMNEHLSLPDVDPVPGHGNAAHHVMPSSRQQQQQHQQMQQQDYDMSRYYNSNKPSSSRDSRRNNIKKATSVRNNNNNKHHPYPNNLYANYYHPFNTALNFAQQAQKQSHNVQSYPANNSFANAGAETAASPFSGKYEDYRDLYTPEPATFRLDGDHATTPYHEQWRPKKGNIKPVYSSAWNIVNFIITVGMLFLHCTDRLPWYSIGQLAYVPAARDCVLALGPEQSLTLFIFQAIKEVAV